MSFSSTPRFGSASQDIYNSPHYFGAGSGSGSGSGRGSGNQSTVFNPPQSPAPAATTINTSVAPSVRQRLIELLHPFRGDFINFVATEATLHERKVLTLAGNLAAIIHHKEAQYGEEINANHVHVLSRNLQALNGQACISIIVQAGGVAHQVVSVEVENRDTTIDALTTKVDNMIGTLFLGA
ncbi:uncharacterized protein J4E87_009042 [Alternaria ethzedia]|uniref:uncharacterized protein n=1 Tax=Alternaria ethzedia TaxID=181014 RepID=UPI0020C478DA|nr:uncharacterized protein J4E87_009042 [Alternaria ethzedia]KAI4615583.1 hypothetical protein J4E87_009042 [Alternaria ethzedia]